MLRWERVPILGSNPVFCFEARRLWRRGRVVWLVLVVLGVGLLGWAVHLTALPPLEELLPLGSSSRLWWIATEALPPTAPLEDWPRFLVGRLGPGWGSTGTYLLMATLLLPLQAAARYVLPALAALSVTADRAAGRLAPVVLTRLRARDILLGKLMALGGPICLLLVLVGGLTGPLAHMAGAPSPMVVLPTATALAGMFVGALLGIRVALSVRHPGSAACVSVFAAGIVLPIVSSVIAHTVDVYALRLFLRFTMLLGVAVDRWTAYLMVIGTIQVAVCAVAFAGLWFSTKRALARAAE
ncbi:MAG: hypothetical protein PVH68_15450 [Armatimonadota bacterium]|jgi:hypothetical protein